MIKIFKNMERFTEKPKNKNNEKLIITLNHEIHCEPFSDGVIIGLEYKFQDRPNVRYDYETYRHTFAIIYDSKINFLIVLGKTDKLDKVLDILSKIIYDNTELSFFDEYIFKKDEVKNFLDPLRDIDGNWCDRIGAHHGSTKLDGHEFTDFGDGEFIKFISGFGETYHRIDYEFLNHSTSSTGVYKHSKRCDVCKHMKY